VADNDLREFERFAEVVLSEIGMTASEIATALVQGDEVCLVDDLGFDSLTIFVVTLVVDDLLDGSERSARETTDDLVSFRTLRDLHHFYLDRRERSA